MPENIENLCALCHKPANPLYMCDQDKFDNQFCWKCFEKTKCWDEHGEGCATMIVESGIPNVGNTKPGEHGGSE